MHTLERLVKVVAGESAAVTDLLAAVYGQVTEGRVYQSASIRTAEAAKIIENTQRNLNIALMNELAMMWWSFGSVRRVNPAQLGE